MRLTLAQIAQLVGGEVRGDPGVVIEGAAGLGEATSKDISFLANAKYAPQLKTTGAGAVLVSPEAETNGRPCVVTKNPHFAWAKVLEVLEKERLRNPSGIHPSAVVSPGARLGAGVAVGPLAVVEEGASIGDNTVICAQSYVGRETVIGRDCLIHPQVTIRERVRIGDRCIFQPGVVIGGDGFGFAFHQGRQHKVPQVGTVEIGNDVEIQANATVDRGAVGATRIGNGTKVDNLAQIAHGVEIGEHCLIVAQVGIGGSTKLGNYVVMGGQAGAAGHLTIGDQTQVGAQGGVTSDLEPKSVVWGTPAHPLRDELKTIAAARRLPQLWGEIKEIKKKLGL
jgi:UDP-3-O-[3-hydroxymyristoyl] glucosamine N-acyltransferase